MALPKRHVDILREAGGLPDPHRDRRTLEFGNIVTAVIPQHDRPACPGYEIVNRLLAILTG